MFQRVAIGAREIACRDRGPRTEPAVLLLHGGGFDLRIWEHCAQALSRRHRAVSLELPGHGDSTGPAVHDVADGARLIEALRERLGVERWIFVGHSMGGAIAQQYHRLFPGRVAALGLISTAPHFGLDPAVVQQWRGAGVEYSRERLDAIVGPDASEALRQHVLALRDRMTPGSVLGDLDTCASWDGRARAFDLDLPVLLISTPHDLPVLQAATRAWSEKLPRAECVWIPDAGHMMLVEQPEATTAAIASWIERVV
jgi:3-oxoadipate enol-lactonase/4-carboxymuconolactone decarboxylase